MKSNSLRLLFASAASLFLTFSAHAGSVTDLSGPDWKLWRDTEAKWADDELFLPPADLTKLPVNVPTGGWDKLAAPESIPVQIPATAEEYFGDGTGPKTAVLGVTWWSRKIKIPADKKDAKIRLLFDSVRQRAEVFVNHKLVAYDLVGNTPFEADLTGIVKPGETADLAVRITNPGGNYDWKDVDGWKWGKYLIPLSHGFGGITGAVRLAVSDPVYVDDIYVQNTPAIHDINIIATVKNSTGKKCVRGVTFSVSAKGETAVLFEKILPKVELAPGDNTVKLTASVPEAKTWDLAHPNLHVCTVALRESAKSPASDTATQTFGFRWFAPDNVGGDAMLRLNGQRIVLRTAISWGFWPINGMIPTPAWAEKQIRAAQAFGMNMLNFHRAIGNPIVFDQADALGLLYFEEPGGYVSGQTDPFAQALAREKLLRMVKRDRSRPSLIIYNMINEQWDKWGANKDEALFAVHRADLQAAHALDPSRTIAYTSAWAGRAKDPDVDPAKMHMRPYDDVVHMNGWFDFHRAGGPETWKQEFYQSPQKHYGRTENRREIVYWGEEGAVSAPPRLALIAKELAAAPRKGWDSQLYLDWNRAFDEFLTAKDLRGSFPTVDDLCVAMGKVSLGHQGRKIEDTRICDLNDGYAINGWEAEIIENHSGVVDCFRNPKADPELIARYNTPFAVAVKPRKQIVQIPAEIPVDFFVLNETNHTGPHTLEIRATDAAGKEVFTRTAPVTLSGGDVFSQLAAEAVAIPLASSTGLFTVNARLLDEKGAAVATGHDEILAVDWKKSTPPANGAVFESTRVVRDFLKTAKNLDVPLFDNTQPPLDWLVVTKSAIPEPFVVQSADLRDPDGKNGLRVTFFDGIDFQKPLATRLDPAVDLNVATGANPDPNVPLTENYSIRWEGQIIPPTTGEYTINVQANQTMCLWLDGKIIVQEDKVAGTRDKTAKLTLTAGQPVAIKLEYANRTSRGDIRLKWLPPVKDAVTPEMILDRARRDGTTVILLDRAETWAEALQTATGIPQGKPFKIGGNWVGGQFFVKNHPLFAELPTDQALDWPYQAVVTGSRMGLDPQGGELVAGAYNTWPFGLGAAVAILPCGKGKIIVSTLNIAAQLHNPDTSAEVARKLFCNYLEAASKP